MTWRCHPRRHFRAAGPASNVVGMDDASTPDALPELHRAIALAAANGANYTWIAGVLAGSLAVDTTTAEARRIAVATLSNPPIKLARQVA